MSQEFHNSACTIRQHGGSHNVIYYLFGHALELSFKAFLLKSGMDARILSRKPYSHNLESLLTSCFDHNLDKIICLTAHQKSCITWLNTIYNDKWFEYPIVNGAWNLPKDDDLQQLSFSVGQAVQAHVSVSRPKT
jgi:hypothetical protein